MVRCRSAAICNFRGFLSAIGAAEGAGDSDGPGPARAGPVTATTTETPSPSDPGTGDGLLLDHRGRRYRVGRGGDIVVLGDWNCDGDRTPAVLRPVTGEVAVFDSWPDADGSISVPASWNLESAHGLAAESDDECDRLRVHTTEGSRLLDSGGSP